MDLEKIHKRLEKNGGELFYKNPAGNSVCVISPMECERCDYKGDDVMDCFEHQEEVLARFRKDLRKERLGKLLEHD